MLVAYVTKQVATEQSAMKIVDILHSNYGLDIDLVSLEEQKSLDLTSYQNIYRSGVRAGRVYGKP